MSIAPRTRTVLPRALAAVVAVLGVVLASLFIAAPAQASHYRADQISWQVDTGTTVEFHLSASLRASYYGGVSVGDVITAGSLKFGDGSSTTPAFEVLSVDTANDVLTGEAHVSHAYAGTGPFNVEFSDCCRLGSPQHINNADGDIVLQTVVDLSKTTASPETVISPIVDCPTAGACAFAIPVIQHTAGSTLNFRFATFSESGISSQPGAPYATNDATIDAATGVYTWDTTGSTVNPNPDQPTFYSTQVVIEELVGGAVVASVPVDFFIRLGASSTNAAPLFVCPTPVDDTTYTIEEGVPFAFVTAASDPDASDVVTTSVIGVPVDATFTPAPGNPGTGTFVWDAPVVGTYVLVLRAQDDSGLQALQRSLTLDVIAAGADLEPIVPDVCAETPAAAGLPPTGTSVSPLVPASALLMLALGALAVVGATRLRRNAKN